MFKSKSKRYSRSSSYRDEYLKNNKGYKGNGYNYHCSYCGKKVTRKEMEVDHIFSVHSSRNKLSTRLLMKLFGITNVNEIKNLTSSCRACNRKKGKMGNGWIIPGFLGKSIWYHRFKTLVKIVVVLIIAYYAFKYFNILDFFSGSNKYF